MLNFYSSVRRFRMPLLYLFESRVYKCMSVNAYTRTYVRAHGKELFLYVFVVLGCLNLEAVRTLLLDKRRAAFAATSGTAAQFNCSCCNGTKTLALYLKHSRYLQTTSCWKLTALLIFQQWVSRQGLLELFIDGILRTRTHFFPPAKCVWMSAKYGSSSHRRDSWPTCC